MTGGMNVYGGTLVLASPNAFADGSTLTVGDPSAFAPVVPTSIVSSQSFAASPSITPVPEPGTLALFAGAGLVVGLSVWRRRKRME
jgi:hypothetical protein